MVARRGGAWSRQVLKVLAAVVLLLVVYEVAGWFDRRLSTLPPLIELVILLAVGAGALAVRLAARRRPEPERAPSVPPAGAPLATAQLPLPRPAPVPAVAAPPRGAGATHRADRVESSRVSEIPAADPYAELERSVARAAGVLEAAASVLETVTRTCASALDRIEDNRRDAIVAADAVAQLLPRSSGRAETAPIRSRATSMEPR